MKSFRFPTLILSALFLGFIGFVIVSSARLPERVATHFDLGGQPNGWMPRSSHVWFMLAFGLAFPLIVPILAFAARYLPDTAINIPRRDYWLGTEQRAVT